MKNCIKNCKSLRQKALALIAGAFFMGASPGVLYAQDNQQKPPVPEVSKAPLKAMQKLDVFLGKWQQVTEMSFDDGKTWQATPPKIVEIVNRHKGMVLAEYPTDLSGAGFHMESYITYDQYRQLYRKAAIDDTWGIMDLYEGNLEKDAAGNDLLVFTNLKAGTFFPMGNDIWRAFRLTMQMTSPQRQIIIDKSDDAGKTWQPAFKVTFKLIE